MTDKTGTAPADIPAAFAAVRDSYGMPELNDEINALDGKIAGKVQLSLYAAVQDLLLDRLVWFLRNADLSKGLAGVVDHHRNGIAALTNVLDKALPPAGVADNLAGRIASLPELAAAPDLVLIADRTGSPMDVIATTFFAAQAFFRID